MHEIRFFQWIKTILTGIKDIRKEETSQLISRSIKNFIGMTIDNCFITVIVPITIANYANDDENMTIAKVFACLMVIVALRFYIGFQFPDGITAICLIYKWC